MNVIRIIALTLGTTLFLSACNKSAEDQAKPVAGGELLPRSVTDDMLPFDTVKSQASLSAPDVVSEGQSSSRSTKSTASGTPETVSSLVVPPEDTDLVTTTP